MEIQATSSSALLDASSSSNRIPVQTLKQDDFLKLLVAQMTSQDPMNPKQDTEFLGQMTQFSSLQQMTELQERIAQLGKDQLVDRANGLIGRTVDVQTDSGTRVRGEVSAVQINDGVPQVVVSGTPYDLERVAVITTNRS